MSIRHTFSAIVMTAIFAQTSLGMQDDKAATEFFEKNIRPVLVSKCYRCHSKSAANLKGGLLLDTRDGIRRGGDSGAAVVPGSLDDSILIKALRHEGPKMPPKEKLPPRVIANFEEWIRMGAADSRQSKTVVIQREIDFEKARQFWAFQPVQNPTVPAPKRDDWAQSTIDRFILHRLESNGLTPVRDADPTSLIRRVYFDLIGLPPNPDQIDEFVNDPKPEVLRKLIRRLLGSKEFGERWGRYWLDTVRYGESTGMERNQIFPHAWRYRDYVIESFASDKPYDQFIREQIAGDLLPYETTEQRNSQLIATGMLALGPKSLNERNKEKFLMDIVDDEIDVVSRAFLGLTVGCARCHDHKFDPIPTAEYYALAGIFRSTETFYGTISQQGNRQAGKLLSLGDEIKPIQTAAPKRGKKSNAQARQLRTARRKLATLQKQKKKGDDSSGLEKKIKTAQARVKSLVQQSKRTTQAKPPTNTNVAAAMAVQDAANPRDTTIRIRGEANERGETVPRGFLTIATLGQASSVDPAHSGRLELAHWMTAPDNPLTARVAVNRVWQHLFGEGIVRSVNNFGANGDRPSHPELLDHLASDFVANDWSVKHLIEEIMTSHVYQLSCDSKSANVDGDPENKLVWRMNHRRLDVEALRDAMLAASGQLDWTRGDKSIVASFGGGTVGREISPDRFVTESTKRSVYLPIVRGAVPEILRVFDFPEPSIIAGPRDVTTVPSQALYLMNSPFVIEQSGHLAQRVLDADGMDTRARVDLAYRLTLGRVASESESAQSIQFLNEILGVSDDSSQSLSNTKVAWTGLCQVLFGSAEFRYLE